MGYLVIVIAGPSLVAFLTPPKNHGPALALWSTFVPAGLALGTFLSGSGAAAFSWQTTCFLWSAAAILALIATIALPRPAKQSAPGRKVPPATVWLLAIGFSFFTTSEVGMLALLPTFLIEERGNTAQMAVLATALASLATLIGGAAASMLLRRATRLAAVATSIVTGLLIPAVLSFAVFPAAIVAAMIADWHIYAAAILLNAFSGVYGAVIFAFLPGLAGDKSHETGGIAVANGVLTQFGAAGSLIGPPLMAVLVGNWGWPIIAPATLVLACLSAAMFAASLNRL